VTAVSFLRPARYPSIPKMINAIQTNPNPISLEWENGS
jgi:hypothetical protein